MSKASVMRRAGELRGEGQDASSALSQAWSEAGGEGSSTSFQPSILLLAVAGYFGWVGYVRYKSGSWNWVPWSSITRFKRLPSPIRQPRPLSDNGSVILPERRYPMPAGRSYETPGLIVP